MKSTHLPPPWQGAYDPIHGMPYRPGVLLLPFIPSTCLIPADTSGNTAHVWIKNRSIKILPAPRSHRNRRLWVAAQSNGMAGRIPRARFPLGDSTGVAINQYADWEEDAKRRTCLQARIRQIIRDRRFQGKKDRLLCSHQRIRARLSHILREIRECSRRHRMRDA